MLTQEELLCIEIQWVSASAIPPVYYAQANATKLNTPIVNDAAKQIHQFCFKALVHQIKAEGVAARYMIALATILTKCAHRTSKSTLLAQSVASVNALIGRAQFAIVAEPK